MKGLTVMAWDTATPTCTIALVRQSQKGFEILADFQSESGVHSQVLPPQTDQILREAGLTPADLDLLAVGRGPGSFTGLRTGLALAKGLAMGAGLPLMGLASPEPLAARMLFLPDRAGEDLAAAPLIDARHGEIFPALYKAAPAGPAPITCLMEPAPLPASAIPACLLQAAEGRKILLAGPALKLFLETRTGPLPEDFELGPVDLVPQASILARLAISLYQADPRGALEAHPPLPLYMKQPDLRQNGLAMR